MTQLTFTDGLNAARYLIDKNARHRGGLTMQDVPVETVLQHLREEVYELEDACKFGLPDTQADELADVLGIVLHLVLKLNLTEHEVVSQMMDKFNRRFVLSDGRSPRLPNTQTDDQSEKIGDDLLARCLQLITCPTMEEHWADEQLTGEVEHLVAAIREWLDGPRGAG